MKVTRGNYEAYLLDRWEGNLSKEEEEVLNDFLAQHPELDIQDALALQDDVSRTKPEEKFDKAGVLYDSVNQQNALYFFVAYYEGDLSNDDEKEVEQFVQDHPFYSKKFKQFGKAHLSQEKVHYPYKRELLAGKDDGHFISIAARNWMIGVAAASFAAFFWLMGSLSNTGGTHYVQKCLAISIDDYQYSPVLFNAREKENKQNEQVNNITANTTFVASKGNTIKVKEELRNTTDPKQTNSVQLTIQKKSFANVKARGLTNVMAALEPQQKDEAVSVAENKRTKAKANQEEIPTILDITAAYLKRKKVLNSNQKPDLKNILNTTLSGVNDDKPILAVNEESDSKRTVIQLGDFKFERTSKK